MEPVDLTALAAEPQITVADEPYKPKKGCPSHHANYETSQMKPLTEEVLSSPDMLFNAKPPNLVIHHEKPEHRIIIMLAAQGMGATAIAERVNRSVGHISQVLRQPWARERLMEELRRAGGDEVSNLLRAELVRSVEMIIEVRDDPKTKPETKLAASEAVLNRYLGKPTQKVETKNEHSIVASEIDEVEKQLSELRAEEKRLVGAARQTDSSPEPVIGPDAAAEQSLPA